MNDKSLDLNRTPNNPTNQNPSKEAINPQNSQPNEDVHPGLEFDNLSVIQAPEMCKIHPTEILQYICLTDKEKICADCLAFGNHRTSDHQIKRVKFLEESVEPKIKRAESLLLKLNEHLKNMEKIYKDNRQETLEIIKELFKKIQDIVKAEEEQLIHRIDLFYDKEDNLRKQAGEDYKKMIDQQVSNYKKIMEVDNPFELLEENPWLNVIQSAVQPEKTIIIDQKLKEVKENIESILKRQSFTWGKISLGFIDLLDSFHEKIDSKLELDEKLFSRENFANSLIQIRNQANFLSTTCSNSTQSDFTFAGSKLLISYPFQRNINSSFDAKEQVFSVLEFKISKGIEEMSKEDALKLCIIRAKLPNIREVHITIKDYTISDKALLDIFNCLLWESDSLNGIFLSCNMKGRFEKSLLFLAENVLSAAKNLQKFSLFFPHCNISKKACNSLNEALSRQAKNLTCLYFLCKCKDADPNTLQKLFVGMPNLKAFGYQIYSKAFNNEVFETFRSITLPSFTTLTEFQLFLLDSKIADSNIKKLLKSLPEEWFSTIKRFKVGFNKSIITDMSIKELAHETLAKFTAIEDFHLAASGFPVIPDLKVNVVGERNSLRELL